MSKQQYTDDQFTHLENDVDKVRYKTGMYISYMNERGVASVISEILYNSIDECRNPRSPGNRIDIEYNESVDTIIIEDNGRGIPSDIIEKIFTTLNSGSNIDSSSKNDLKVDTLGRNGAGTLAINALAESLTVTTHRGGTENIVKELTFNEGIKVSEEVRKCSPDKHGLRVVYKPSKVLGKKAKIVWSMIHQTLTMLQFLNTGKISINSTATFANGKVLIDTYKLQPFGNILKQYNNEDSLITNPLTIKFEDNNVIEEMYEVKHKRFIHVETVFAFTSNMANPYIDSFANSNNTVDGGSHIDGALEGICRYFQNVTKATLTDRDKLDIKWDDVKAGLSLAVSFRSNMEVLFTGQTKHKISNTDVFDIVKNKTIESFQKYFADNPAKLKEYINIIKTNARARREGDKARTAVVKENLTNWNAYKMKNYDPCSNKGKAYKELFIVEGLSAKGTLKVARDPKFQALYSIRGVSLNAWNTPLDKIVGPKGNQEFNNLVAIMGCNIGIKFDMEKLQFDKIIIATDADIDGLFIRSLLCCFFFKFYPEIIKKGKLFIAEPPLYRSTDKKNPFIINKVDYNDRYIKEVMKNYDIGISKSNNVNWLNKDDIYTLLSDTTSYLEDMELLAKHYLVNDRLIEYILEELSVLDINIDNINNMLSKVNMSHLISRITEKFPEIYYDQDDHIIKGIINGKYQSIELGNRLVRKGLPLIDMIRKYGYLNGDIILRNTKTKTSETYSLLEVLKVLRKYQPVITHRFKGLGENSDADIKQTIMDPNTRTLIRVNIGDIENDTKVFNVLRGSSPYDAASRKLMMKEFVPSRYDIDT